MSEQAQTPEIAALENALAALVPAPAPINRDLLMFQAGQASIRPKAGRAWPAAAGVLALVAAVLGGVLAWRPAPEPQTQIVYVYVEKKVPAPPPPAKKAPTPPMPDTTPPAELEPSYPQTPYLQMQNQLLRWGLDGLPALPPSPPAESVPSRKQLLGRSADDGPPPSFFPLNLLKKLGAP